MSYHTREEMVERLTCVRGLHLVALTHFMHAAEVMLEDANANFSGS